MSSFNLSLLRSTSTMAGPSQWSQRISRYEAGIHEPLVAVASQLGVALQIPLAFLYCEDEDMADLLLVINRLTPSKRQLLLEYGRSVA